MSDSISEAAGKGVSIEIDGKEYKISPLTIDDLAEFESYIKSNRLGEFLGAAKDMDLSEKRDMVKMIMSQDLSADDGEGSVLDHEMSTLSGARFIFYMVLRKDNKDITLDKMGDLINAGNIDTINQVLYAASTVPPPAAEANE